MRDKVFAISWWVKDLGKWYRTTFWNVLFRRHHKLSKQLYINIGRKFNFK
jgi:hypothetical protein